MITNLEYLEPSIALFVNAFVVDAVRDGCPVQKPIVLSHELCMVKEQGRIFFIHVMESIKQIVCYLPVAT